MYLIYEFDERSEKDHKKLGNMLNSSIRILQKIKEGVYEEIVESIQCDTDESMDEILYEIEVEYIDDICDKDEVIWYLNDLKEALTIGWVSDKDKDTTKPHDHRPHKRKKINNK